MNNNVLPFPAPQVANQKEQVNVRLTATAKRILAKLSTQMGISQADVLEILLREEDKKKLDLIQRK